MTRKIICTPHDEKGKPVYGTRYEFDIRAIPNDGPERLVSGVLELCDADGRPIVAALEYIEQMQLAGMLDGSPPAPPEPKTRETPASPETPDSWNCLTCRDDAVYVGQQRIAHARFHHSDRKIWDVKWKPLFDASGWQWCSCGYPTKTTTGLNKHHEMSGHTGVRDDELSTGVGAALNRAVEGRH